MPREYFLETSHNPCIEYSGKAKFGKNHYCTWKTGNGSTSMCTITNEGKKNTLTFVVSGAHMEMKTTDGNDFNGQHTIPPNNPTMNITVVGDCQGKQVIIFNMSSLDTDCSVVTVVPGDCDDK